jgi:flagellar biosynthesis/type III secretory pathway M-ring protein FliF/YscJ
MDFLKAQIARIQEQLAGLTATQKMLVICLLTIMVMTLMGWSHWAGEAEMSPLLDGQNLSTEDIGQIAANLDAQGITHEVMNNNVYVPADRKLEIMAVLGYSNALPRNFEDGFDSIVKEMNWLDPPDKNAAMFLRAKEQTLKSILRRMPGIADAEVVIDDTEQRDIGENDVQPVATVMITTDRNNRMDIHHLAETAADMVCGAKAGLTRGNVRVAIDGQSIQIRDRTDDGTPDGSDAASMQKQFEDQYQRKIEHLLQDIAGVIVSVTVKVDTSVTMTTIHKIDPKQTVSVQTHSEESTQEQDAQQAAAEEPGAQPNTSMSLPASSGGGSGGSNSSLEKDDFDVDHGKQDEVIKQGAGMATVMSASVRVPRSYFVQTYKQENGKDPDDPAAFNAYINTQLAQIHDEVKGCAVFPSDDALYVGVFSDIAQPELPVAQTTSSSSVSNVLTRHGKELGVGALAVVSLFMVSMMVRKGAPAATAATGGVTEPLAADNGKTLSGNEAVVGSAVEDNASLDGMELDEETVKAQRMLDQVKQMVEANPDSAANLVKRWLNR